MATALPNKFLKYELTPEEQIEARILSPATRMWLETMRTEFAEQKLVLSYNPKAPNDHIAWCQEEAAITGSLNVLSQILDPQ